MDRSSFTIAARHGRCSAFYLLHPMLDKVPLSIVYACPYGFVTWIMITATPITTLTTLAAWLAMVM